MTIFKFICSFGSKRFRRFLKRKIDTFRGAYQLSQFKRFFHHKLPNQILQYEKSKYGQDLSIPKRTDRDILCYIEKKSKEYFKGFKLPNVLIHVSNKACLEGSRNRDFLINTPRPITPAEVDDYFQLVNDVSEECISKSFNCNHTVRHIQVQYRDWETDRKSTRLNSSHRSLSRMPSSA